MSAELEAIDGLTRVHAASIAAFALQLVEIESKINVLLNLEKDRLVLERGDSDEVAEFLKTLIQIHRKAVLEDVQTRFRLIHPDIDLALAQ
jgi:hypothetical protein